MSYLGDFMERLYEAPDNAQAGYRYTSVGFVMLHVTSAVQTDEAAIAYIEQVNKWYPKTRVMILEKRDAGQQDWRMIHRVEEELARFTPVPGGDSEPEEDEQPAAQAVIPTVPAVPVAVPPIPRPAD